MLMSMDRVKSNSDPTLKLNEIKRKKGMISIEQKKKWVAQMEFQSAASVSAVSGFHVSTLYRWKEKQESELQDSIAKNDSDRLKKEKELILRPKIPKSFSFDLGLFKEKASCDSVETHRECLGVLRNENRFTIEFFHLNSLICLIEKLFSPEKEV
jgi:transposase-like protein